jgi:hypothetical protein
MIRSALLIHGVNRHFVWRAVHPPGDGQEKGKKRQLTEGGKNPDVFNGPLGLWSNAIDHLVIDTM